ncbi:MAG: Unknown protein [uncultured Sulfurovum sp.]|uniref:Uncharacterized protein n=1 Tax=uncultured Sulfurovum sp. TaxID=269237 RepID=A0A6S6U1P3_9BACT|nr:MAG: Unknown protein [uncultured Sulfurovum sp.]
MQGLRTIKSFYYEYDALGRRVMKEVYNPVDNHSTTKHYYLYDNQNIIAILDKDKHHLATITHHDTKIDTPLSITTIHGTYYYHRDHQGSIIALSNEHGEIIETITYDEHYGSILEHKRRNNNETLNPYGYTGREIETNDLYYYRARYYDPMTQRFLSLDPIGFSSGDFNFYRYVGNSPVSFVDPFGLKGLGGVKDGADGLNDLSDIVEAAADGGITGVVDTVLEQRGLKIDAEVYDKAKEMREICLENASELDSAQGLEAAKQCEINYGIDGNNIYIDEKTTFGFPDATIPFTDIPLGGQPDFLKRTNDDVNYSTEAYQTSDGNTTVDTPPIEVPDTSFPADVCSSYDDVIADGNHTDDMIGHYEEDLYNCAYDNEVNPNYNTSYEKDNTPYIAGERDTGNHLITGGSDNNQTRLDNNSTVSPDNNLTEEEQMQKDIEAYDRGERE